MRLLLELRLWQLVAPLDDDRGLVERRFELLDFAVVTALCSMVSLFTCAACGGGGAVAEELVKPTEFIGVVDSSLSTPSGGATGATNEVLQAS